MIQKVVNLNSEILLFGSLLSDKGLPLQSNIIPTWPPKTVVFMASFTPAPTSIPFDGVRVILISW